MQRFNGKKLFCVLPISVLNIYRSDCRVLVFMPVCCYDVLTDFGIWTLARKMMSFRFLENVFVLDD